MTEPWPALALDAAALCAAEALPPLAAFARARSPAASVPATATLVTHRRSVTVNGVSDVSRINPDNQVHDQALPDRPGNRDIRLDLLRDYGSNVPLYPEFQAFFREHQPPTLIVRDKNDRIFPAEGAPPYLRDLPKAELHMLDTGPFAPDEARRHGIDDPRLSRSLRRPRPNTILRSVPSEKAGLCSTRSRQDDASSTTPKQAFVAQATNACLGASGGVASSTRSPKGSCMEQSHAWMVATALLPLASVAMPAFPGSVRAEDVSPILGVTIPDVCRQWGLVAPSRESEPLDEPRAILGNATAMQACRNGALPFPDGTVFAKLAWKHALSAEFEAAFVPGTATTVQIMIKDSRRSPATGGWGFGGFIDGVPVDEAQHKTCLGCHQALVKDHDLVFTRFAP